MLANDFEDGPVDYIGRFGTTTRGSSTDSHHTREKWKLVGGRQLPWYGRTLWYGWYVGFQDWLELWCSCSVCWSRLGLTFKWWKDKEGCDEDTWEDSGRAFDIRCRFNGTCRKTSINRSIESIDKALTLTEALRGATMAQEVRAVVWQSKGSQTTATLGMSKCPRARHLTPNCSWRAGWYLAWHPIAIGMCVNGWMKASIVQHFGKGAI